MEDKKYTKENLNVLGIFQLRDLARSVGVHLPTTYKKDELIEKILQVANGEIKPFVPKNKKGRPPKTFVSTFSGEGAVGTPQKKPIKFSWLLGEFLPAESSVDFAYELKVCMPDAVFYSKKENKPQNEVGVVFVEPTGAGALHIGGLSNITKDNIAYISSEVVRAYNIKTGDELKCSVFVNTENEKVVYEIFEINSKKANELKRDYDAETDFDVVSPCERIDFGQDQTLKLLNGEVPVGKGQRVFVLADAASCCTKFLSKVSKVGSFNNMKTIVVAIDKRPEEKCLYDGNGVEYIFCNFDMTPFKQAYLVGLGIERAKRLCEMGQDVLLVVDNMLSVLRAYDCLFEKEESSYGIEAQIAVKKIFAIGGNVLRGGSITLMAGVPNGDSDANKFFERIESFCNSHIYLKTENNSEFSILQKSYTENVENLLK